MSLGRVMTCAIVVLTACSAPDYTPVRDWASAASLAAGYPRAAAGTTAGPATQATALAGEDGVLAMQEALATYLVALARIADDGVLPYRDDPFVQLAARTALTNEPGAQAIVSLGALLRRATRANWQAPQLRSIVVAADPTVQALIDALSASVARSQAPLVEARAEAAAYYAQLGRQARGAAERQTLQDWARLRDQGFAADLAARSQYGRILAQVAQDHGMLKVRAGDITEAEVVQHIRAAEDRLRRATLALPRADVLPIPLPRTPGRVLPSPR